MNEILPITCQYCNSSNPTTSSVCNQCGSSFITTPLEVLEKQKGLPAGTVLDGGRFQILNEIGRGGFGIVYLAYYTDAKRYVVIKECFPEGVVTRDSNHRVIPKPGLETEFQSALMHFKREAYVLKNIKHKSSTRVIGLGVGNNTFYTILEYLQGETLEQRIASGKLLTNIEAITQLDTILELLEELHALNFLHRDIKPANIILTKEHAELLDFGSVIKFLTGQRQKVTSRLLTPAYAPLEQYGEVVSLSPATDLYALGATFYEAMTGVKPPNALERANGAKLTPIVLVYPLVDLNLANAIEKSLEMRIEDRFSNAIEMRKSLRQPLLEKKLNQKTFPNKTLQSTKKQQNDVVKLAIYLGFFLIFLILQLVQKIFF